ncbi:MAG: DUF1569 domain-containing protein [Saprospiraceae bacterium]|nr:DUF1569 domain-containing protein [Saprospiraceae bacterium]
MTFPNIFSKDVSDRLIERINRLTPATTPQWGKMQVDQMLAHCNVAYEFVYESDKFEKPGAVKKFFIKLFAKNIVVGDKPYKKNTRTAPEFMIEGARDFEKEKKRLIDHVQKTQQLGENHFANRESHSFGPLTINEWNTLFYKHLDHHLTQFGV